MAHHHERARAHTPPRLSDQERSGPRASSARIDCDTCPVAGHGCAGCMVALLGPVRLRLDAAERAAVQVLLQRGLIDSDEASAAHSVPDLPDWIVNARDRPEAESALRAIS